MLTYVLRVLGAVNIVRQGVRTPFARKLSVYAYRYDIHRMMRAKWCSSSQNNVIACFTPSIDQPTQSNAFSAVGTRSCGDTRVYPLIIQCRIHYSRPSACVCRRAHVPFMLLPVLPEALLFVGGVDGKFNGYSQAVIKYLFLGTTGTYFYYHPALDLCCKMLGLGTAVL